MSSSESSNKTQIPPSSCANINGPPEKSNLKAQTLTIAQLKTVLDHVNPFCSAEKHDQVIRVLHHETNGSDEGMALADAWSNKGDNYPGTDALASTWRSYSDGNDEPETSETLRMMVEDCGFDWDDICNRDNSDFETREPQMEESNGQPAVTSSSPNIPFVEYSLQGMSEQLATEISDQVPLLGPIILMFQSSVIYASPNTGKTLIILWLLINAIKQGKLDPSCVFYFNLDDTPNGLIEKLKLAEEYGFHILAEGYNDFKAEFFLVMLADLVENNRAKGIIIILDTLKKFTACLSGCLPHPLPVVF
jgi:hypothetical protein